MQFSSPLKSLNQFLIIFLLFGLSCSTKKEPARVLVFSKTAGYRHESIATGIEAIKKLGMKHGFHVDTTENAANFYEENLKRYNTIIFLNTTGDVLNPEQQNDFERFIQAGGGYVGIHAATDTEYDWPWYGKLAGAYFESHPSDPNVQTGLFYVVDKNHPATDSIPEKWERTDEFYSFKNINPEIKILIKIDEKSYHGGKNGDDHPMSWYHEFDGGRAFYTNMGHTPQTYSELLFLKHLWGGIQYALGGEKNITLDYKLVHTKRIPEESRFTKVVLDEKLEEPVELAVLPDNKVLFIERRGNVKIYDPSMQKTKIIAKIPVSTKYKSKKGEVSEAEDGLLGLAIDPQFEKNNWIYLYYSPAGDDPKNILTRYELKGDVLVEASKKIILEVVTQREQCCHTGGSIAFDAEGNLFLSTGDNTSPFKTAYSPIDERPGRSPWDAQKSSANTNDLRGKVIRIHPEVDGTYTIPEGNLFPKGKDKTRPEIYVMGTRNPYRISVDKKTGFLYWGDVGPDSGKDSVNRGPKAFDEINQARKPGYYGWPYFVGDNHAYYERDFLTGKAGPLFDPAKPLNTSPNNTGLTELPPAQKAFIWYPYDASPEFPLVGKGGRTAMAGPVYHLEDFKNVEHAFPDYYDGKLFIYEWMRGWIMVVTMDNEGNYISMERFMPSYRFSNPMDMEFGNDGHLYLLEYGTGWFQENDDARLVRIEYNGGNRKPQLKMAASKTEGSIPLTINFSSAGTRDFDHDELKYEWKVTSADGAHLKTFSEPNPSFTFDKTGIYNASLTVTDQKGASAIGTIEIKAGNEPPTLTFEIEGNQTFFFPDHPFNYEVKVNDKEDGSLEKGISPEEVFVSINYLKEGLDEDTQGHLNAEATSQFARGKKLMDESDCKACHIINKKSIGPMYLDIAKKYKNDPKAIDYLAKKVINGGGGVWGETRMAAHPQLSVADVSEIIKYIFSLDNDQNKSLPPKGSYTTIIPKDVSDRGALMMRASYTDKGANGISAISSEKILILQSPNVPAAKANKLDGIQGYQVSDNPLEYMIGLRDKSYIQFNQVDLTNIDQIDITVLSSAGSLPVELLNMTGGIVEIHIDSPAGPLLGQTTFIAPAKKTINKQKPNVQLVKITPTDGKHNIYYVYRNEKSAAGQPLFMISNIRYRSTSKDAGKGNLSAR